MRHKSHRVLRATFAAFVFGCAGAQCQVYTVSETDPSADFQHIQVALDTVEPGATLLVQSDLTMGYYGGDEVVRIWQDVTLIGTTDPRPQFKRMGLWIDSPGITVALRNLAIDTNYYYSAIEWEQGGGGRLFADSCQILGEADHEGTLLEDVTAVFTDCEIAGRGGEPADSGAIYAYGSTVFLNRCHVHASDYDAVVGAVYFASETLIEGRISGDVRYLQGSVLHVPLLDVNSTVQIRWAGTVNGHSLIGFGFRSVDQIDQSRPWIVIPEIVLTLSNSDDGWGYWTTTIPDDPSLVGIPVLCQSYDIRSGQVSCPVLRVMGN